MKIRLAVLAGALLLPSVAFAGLLSNPALSVPTGKGTIGLEYFFDSNDFHPDDDVNFDDVRITSSQVYVKGAYSGFDGNEVYLKLGAADTKSNEAFSNNSDFSKSFNFSGAVGVKQSFEVAPQVRVGGIVQYSLFTKAEQTKGNETIAFKNPWQIDAALAATYVGDGWAPYAGPVFTWHRFKADLTTAGVGTVSTTYKQANVAGGFVGVDLFSGPVRGNVEVQLASQMSAGASISYLFP